MSAVACGTYIPYADRLPQQGATKRLSKARTSIVVESFYRCPVCGSLLMMDVSLYRLPTGGFRCEDAKQIPEPPDTKA
jgi:hypothetical protein